MTSDDSEAETDSAVSIPRQVWTAAEQPLPDSVSPGQVRAEVVRAATESEALDVTAPGVGKATIRTCHGDWVLDVPEKVYRFAGIAEPELQAPVSEARMMLARAKRQPEVLLTVEHPACGGQAVLHRVLRRGGVVRRVERLLGCWQLEPGNEVVVRLDRV